MATPNRLASPERAGSTAQEASPPPSETEVITASVVEVVPGVKKASGLGRLGGSKWASSENATSTAPEPQAKEVAGTGGENGSVEIVKTKKIGGLADLKYPSPEKKSPEEPASASSRSAGQSTPNRSRPTPRQCPAPGGLNGGNAKRGRSRVFWAAENLARTQEFHLAYWSYC